MGSKYTTTSVSNYKAYSPPDDGSHTAANLIKYSTIYTDLTDPIKTAFDSVNTKLVNSPLTDYIFNDNVQIATSKTLTIGGNTVDSFASGTRLIFQQTNAPTGWTKEPGAAYEDVAIALTTGIVSTGGSIVFSTVFGRTATDSHVLTISEIPSHDHGIAGAIVGSGLGAAAAGGNPVPGGHLPVSAQGGGAGHTHGNDMRVKYAKAIIASKN